MTADAAGRRPWRPWRTIRFRITALALAAVLVVLAASATLLVQAQRAQLLAQVDDDVAAELGQLAAQVEQQGAPDAMPLLGDDVVAQILTPAGALVVESDDLAEEGEGIVLVDASSAPPAQLDDDGELEDVEIADVTLPDDETGRIAAVEVDSPDGPLVVAVAHSEIDLEDAVSSLGAILVVAVPVVAAVMAGATWVLVGRTLRPVDRIRRRVDEIGGDDLAVRVPEPGTHDEIDDLARTMNAMLGRLEGAAAREREFTSDASHELRTPLARMRLALEVDRTPGADALPQSTAESLLQEVIAMQHLVDDLLQLARDEAAVAPAEVVDLDVVVEAEVSTLRRTTGHVVDASGVRPVQVLGRPRALAQVVRNLLDNAERHARSTVQVRLDVGGDGQAVLVVADDGPGIAPEDRTRVLDRFARLDDARATSTGGTGLGLAIVATIVARHHGSVEVGEAPGGGASFTVRLPAEAT